MATPTSAITPARPLRKDAARNRELLLAAAREVFAERGLDATLDDVAARAGLGVATAYRHFANKYQLASAVFEQTVEQIVAYAEQATTAADPWQALVGFLEQLLQLQTADRGLREVLMGSHDDQHGQVIYDRVVGPVTAIVERARASGDLRADCQPSDLAIIVIMLCEVADLAADASPELWRRYLQLLLQSLHPNDETLRVPALHTTELRRAMIKHNTGCTRRGT